jgi:hypothetical protein
MGDSNINRDKVTVKTEKLRMGWVYLSNYEAAVIKRMRQSEYGDYKIIKTEGQPRRIVEGSSSIILEDEADDMFGN